MTTIDKTLGAIRDNLPPADADLSNRERNAHALLAAVDAVLALHFPHPDTRSALYPTPLCDCGFDYPCPTVTAVANALTGGDPTEGHAAGRPHGGEPRG